MARIAQEQPTITREVYSYDEETALKCVQRIGTALCPTFALDADNRGVFAALTAWMTGNPFTAIDPVTKRRIEGRTDKGIYLFGGTGTGKSLAMKIMAYMTCFDRPRLRFSNAEKPVELKWTSVRADRMASEFAETGSIGAYKSIPMLLIEDMGNEPAETLYMGNRVDVIRQVLEARGDRRDQLTFITTNLPLGEVKGVNPIRQRYGDRAESRLIEMCNYLYLGGKDRRLNINTNNN